METRRYTLPKQERLCGRTDIATLLSRGKFSNVPGCLRFCFLRRETGSTGGSAAGDVVARGVAGSAAALNRIMIAVPKRNFKRAVVRNLLKRRIRESYRKQKHALEGTGTDILFVYTAKEAVSYGEIYDAVGRIIDKINKYGQRAAEIHNP